MVPCNHDAFHFDWQELLQRIKAHYYLSCAVRKGLTGVTFSLVRRGASIHYPVSSELAAGTDCCLSPQRPSVPFYVCHTLTRKNESMQSCTRAHRLVPSSCLHTRMQTDKSSEHFAQYMYSCLYINLYNVKYTLHLHILVNPLHSFTPHSLPTSFPLILTLPSLPYMLSTLHLVLRGPCI